MNGKYKDESRGFQISIKKNEDMDIIKCEKLDCP